MIAYLDTSAFLKLYLNEPGSNQVRHLVKSSAATCTHVVTYAEMCAGLARASRMLRLDTAQYEHQKHCFRSDWAAMHTLSVDETVIRRAGVLAEGFELRGYDSVHLAAAESIWRQLNTSFQFAAFDCKLLDAARLLGMGTLD